MADTKRLLAALQSILADNTTGDISPQDVRDFLVSVYPDAIPADNYVGADVGAKIQAALDALPAAGGIVDATSFTGAQSATTVITMPTNATLLLGEMTITFSSTQMFIVATDSSMLGTGIDRTNFIHDTNAAADGVPLVAPTGTAGNGNTDRVLLHGFTIDGNQANQTNGTVHTSIIDLDMDPNSATVRKDIEISHVSAKNGVGRNIRVTNAWDVHIHDCKSQGVKSEGNSDIEYQFFNIGHNSGENIKIENNVIDSSVTNTGNSIKLSCSGSAEATAIRNVIIRGNRIIMDEPAGGGFAIELFSENLGVFNGYVVDSNYMTCATAPSAMFGISIGGKNCNNGTVTNNHIYDFNTSVELSNCFRVRVLGNYLLKGNVQVDGNGGPDCEDIVIANNVLDQCGTTNGGAVRGVSNSSGSWRGINVIGNVIIEPSTGSRAVFFDADPAAEGNDITITGNYFKGNNANGIHDAVFIIETNNVLVANNYCTDWLSLGAHAFCHMDDTTNVAVIDNFLNNVSNEYRFTDTNTGYTLRSILSVVPDVVTSGSLAVSLTTATTSIDSSGGTMTVTIADGYEGQEKTLVMTVAGNVATISANLSVTSIAFDAVGEAAKLVFSGATWSVVGAQGSTVTA